MRLAGKRALVTGGFGGLGRAIAERFAAEGARVMVVDIVSLSSAGCRPRSDAHDEHLDLGKMDVADPADWLRATQEAQRRWGGVDILVNNAAVASGLTRIEDRTPDDWDRSMAVNVKGPFLGTRAMLPLFRAQGGGTIVNVSSIAGLGQSGIMDPAYACSKAALTMLTKVTAAQHAAEGVRCNAVHPGPIDSPLAHAAFPNEAALARRLARVPMGRFAAMDEVVAAILFLASEESSYINGASLAVDGGALVQ